MSAVLVIILIIFLSITASTFISLNFKRNYKEHIRTPVKKPRKESILKLKSVNIKETTDDSIEDLVKYALKRKGSIHTVETLKVDLPRKSTDRKSSKRKSEDLECPNLLFSKPVTVPVQFYSPFNSGLLIDLDKGSFVDFSSDSSFHDKISPPGFTLHQDRL